MFPLRTWQSFALPQARCEGSAGLKSNFSTAIHLPAVIPKSCFRFTTVMRIQTNEELRCWWMMMTFTSNEQDVPDYGNALPIQRFQGRQWHNVKTHGDDTGAQKWHSQTELLGRNIVRFNYILQKLSHVPYKPYERNSKYCTSANSVDQNRE